MFHIKQETINNNFEIKYILQNETRENVLFIKYCKGYRTLNILDISAYYTHPMHFCATQGNVLSIKHCKG